MKTIYNIILTTLLIILLKVAVSCEKMLEVDMPGDQIGSEQVFEDTSSAYAALAGLYASLYSNSVVSGTELSVFLSGYTDDLDGYYINNVNGTMDIFNNQQLAANTVINSTWTNAYNQIYMANALIRGMDNSKNISQTDKDRIKGEALLARSIIYLYLQQVFGDIPYTLTTDYQQNQNIGKTSAQEVLSLLQADIQNAIGLLKDKYRSSERIYLNKKAGELTLAKVMMLKKDWQNAEILLKGIIQSPLYQFQSDINKVFNKNAAHVIWQLKPPNAGDATKESTYYYFENAVPIRAALSQNLVDSFDAGDLRMQNWIAPVTYSGKTYYRNAKYKNRMPGNNTEYSIVLRLEEVYLLLAEALVQQNKIAEAISYLNATRLRAGLIALPISLGKNEALDQILWEDRKEFFCEMGHRFLDLKRMDKLSTLTTMKPNWKSYYNLWPLPQNDLSINPNLNPQNPGY